MQHFAASIPCTQPISALINVGEFPITALEHVVERMRDEGISCGVPRLRCQTSTRASAAVAPRCGTTVTAAMITTASSSTSATGAARGCLSQRRRRQRQNEAVHFSIRTKQETPACLVARCGARPLSELARLLARSQIPAELADFFRQIATLGPRRVDTW